MQYYNNFEFLFLSQLKVLVLHMVGFHILQYVLKHDIYHV